MYVCMLSAAQASSVQFSSVSFGMDDMDDSLYSLYVIVKNKT